MRIVVLLLASLLWVSAGITAEVPAPAPVYVDHEDVSYYMDAGSGEKRPIHTVADWAKRRQHVLAHMQEVMGPLPNPVPKVLLDVRVVEETLVGNMRRQKVVYHTDSPDKTISAWLILPAQAGGGAGKLPAMLCLHQTTAIGKDEPAGLGGIADLHYALELSRRGYVTLSPDYPGFGERAKDLASDYASTTMRVIFENMRAVDLLAANPAVDADRLGVIGHSLGGHNSLFTAVFDTRLKVIVSSCGFGTFRSYQGGNLKTWASRYYMPLIATRYGNDPARVPFDFTEVVSCLAPRAFFANAPLHDGNFVAGSVAQIFAACAPVYALFGAEKGGALQLRQPEAGHQFLPATREEAYQFIDKHLQGAKK
jgi:dienelactone hydrolase